MPRGIKEDVMNALRRAQTVGLARVNPHTGYAAFLPGSSEPENQPEDPPPGQPEANTDAQSEGPPPGQPQASTEVESQPTHDSIEKNQPMGQTT